jgi:adenosylhomocysteine nucleosidase
VRIGIIAALPGELKPLVKGWRRVKAATPRTKKWMLERGGDEWVAVCAGMGADAARRAFAEAERDGALEMVLSVGWVGALHDEVRAGSAQVPTVVIDSQTGEQFSLTQGKRKWRLVTTPRVADAKEKARLVVTYPGAVLVDMEAATVARMAAMRNIPVVCIKGVSDELNHSLPDLNPYIDASGYLKMLPFLASIALKPRYLPALIQLGRNSARAAEAMRDLIVRFMEEKNVDRLIRSGSI